MSEIKKELVVALFSSLIGGIVGILTTLITANYIQKEDVEISTRSCSDTGPEEVWLKNLETGYETRLDDERGPSALQRVTSITNSGSKSIDDADIYINIENPTNAQIFETLIFYESTLSKHILTASEDGTVFTIHIKDFNPKDKIYILTNSGRSVGVNVFAKLKGFTLSSRITRDSSCWSPWARSYGGAIAYKKLVDGCMIDPKNLNLRCNFTDRYRIPRDFPLGRSQIEFR